ncbi:MAG: carboxymuconolactone decarboxylase family protein [Betaproteobacteria bacterium]|jgi:AhpD family alkylhydroperoxidase|nr:carboxymuconolactone decarboxylase family protein [Betaproteobacteria bacterium]MDH4292739.1 carboxymuconolactone decarboxylase family protein [Betaproteobacteria bacterium]MDH5343242.1 carboxymuconolactone decarboxylase family protein [Betaproteobacteria bacterium]
MTRVPLIGEERGDLAAFIARVKAERGKLINLYRVLLNSPTIAAGWLDFNSTIRYQTTLDAALREMIILRVSVLNGAEYQARIHGASHALKAGLSAEQIAALSDWQDSTLFSPAQRAALAWTDAMTRQIEVPDALHDELKKHFDDQAIVEITVLAGAYNMHTRVARALRIEPEAAANQQP